MLIAVPFGLGAAIFVSEFCGPKAKEVYKVESERFDKVYAGNIERLEFDQ